MHVLQAWRSGNGSGITVALLSDGVSAKQPYLAGSVVNGPDFTGSDRSPHGPYYGRIGTSLASLIAGHGRVGARSSNNWVYGIAPAAKILSIRVIPDKDDPGYTKYESEPEAVIQKSLATGIEDAVNGGARVISMSIGYSAPSAQVRAALQYAYSKGAVLVAS